MAKFSPFEMKQIIADYIKLESSRKSIHHSEMGYVPSIVRETLEAIDTAHPAPNDHCYVRAVKQCMSERGMSFEKMFQTLHAMFYLLQRGQPYEIAKKKARLVASGDLFDRSTYWTSFVKPEHVEVLRAA